MYYLKLGSGMFVGFLLGELITEREISLRTVLKAAFGALIALGIIAWWTRRKRGTGTPSA